MKDNFLLPGFKKFSNSAQKFHKRKFGRLSGGLVLGYKNHLENGISFIKSCTYYIWCKLNHTFFNLENAIYLCALYIPPRDSPYFNPDIFFDIETDITFFHSKGSTMLAGDFNARTGKANDFIDVDNCNRIPGYNIPSPFISLPSGQNFDNNINDHGKHLLELCKSCDLRILSAGQKLVCLISITKINRNIKTK